jgi:hypothetical protein
MAHELDCIGFTVRVAAAVGRVAVSVFGDQFTREAWCGVEGASGRSAPAHTVPGTVYWGTPAEVTVSGLGLAVMTRTVEGMASVAQSPNSGVCDGPSGEIKEIQDDGTVTIVVVPRLVLVAQSRSVKRSHNHKSDLEQLMQWEATLRATHAWL